MFGHRKRALSAEKKVLELERELKHAKASEEHYRTLWLGTRKPARETHARSTPVTPLRQQSSAAYQSVALASSAPSSPSGGFDMTSALLGGMVGHALASSSHSSRDDSPAFSSGGGGDYGGGGASSSWESSSCISSYDSGSSSSSSDSGSSCSSSSD